MRIIFPFSLNSNYKIKFQQLIFILSLIFFSSINLSAQENDLQKEFLRFQYFGVDEGLSQGTIYSIFQDSHGFLWLATQFGLNRYDGYTFKSYVNSTTDSTSISSNFVLSIAEDKNGDLWVSTENGLNRFNYNHETFTRYLQDSTDMSVVSSVYVDKNGVIWAGTPSRGLYRLEVNNDKTDDVTITNYRHDSNNFYSLSSNLARCIFEDSKGRIWVGTDKGLNLLADSKKGIFKKITNIYNENKTVEAQIWTICESKSGRLVVGSTAGLFSVFEDLNNSYYLIDFFIQNRKLFIPNTVISAYQDNSDNLWLGTYAGGLYLWNEKNLQLSKIFDRLNKNDLQTSTVYSIKADYSKVLWIGTKSDLLKYSPTNSYFDSFENTIKQSKDENLVLTFLEDKDGKIWIGKSLNLELFDPIKEKTEKFNLEHYISYRPHDLGVKSIYQDSSGTLWIGTLWRGLFEMKEKNEKRNDYSFHQYWYYANNNPDLYDNAVLKMIEDKWGYLWLATKYGVKRFNKENKKFYDLKFTPQSKIKPPESIVYEIYKSPSNPNIIWIGTRSQGMFEVKLGNNENEITGLSHFTPDSKIPNSLSAEFVRTILEDKKGRLWVGTVSSGLHLLNNDSTTFTKFGTKDGLPSNAILGLLEDNLGYLWISTISGLCRFDPETFESISFSKSDGLQNSEFNGGANFKSKSGDLYFGGTKGFDIVHPDLVQKNKRPPPVVITEIRLYNNSIFNRVQRNENTASLQLKNDYGSIELNHNENVISFEFSALDYVNPANNKYAYKMEGIDTSWSYVSSRRFANYSQIPPGEYFFKVKAANNNNVWNNEGALIKIIIDPPFWQTLWFKALSTFILIAFLFFLYKYRIRKMEEKKRTLEIQVKERTEAAQKIQDALSQVEKLKNELEAENIYLQDEIKLTHNFESIISTSESFKKILYKVEQVSSTDAIVLILGESGTGKELLARAIHSLSNRKNKPLIKVNCAALPANLIESELFGHEKGAFTGAYAKKIGRFELANGGTIFLDEIGELPLELQAKLLRVLQENEFERVGGTNPIKVDVRVIAATNRDLELALKQGTFREDLYYRLNVFPIQIPPLRERREDIPVLVNHFVNKHAKKIGKKIESISPKLMKKLIEYDWPGNVRELENVIERAIIICPGNNFKIEDSFLKNKENGNSGNYQPLDEIERKYIIEILESTNWRVSGPNGAAKILGLVPSTLNIG